MSGKPIKPSDVAAAKTATIPPEVFDVFNALITENWDGSSAVVRQDDAAARVRARFPGKNIYALRWMDVEPAYEKAGWRVVYDKPGYNETYEASYTFYKKRLR